MDDEDEWPAWVPLLEAAGNVDWTSDLKYSNTEEEYTVDNGSGAPDDVMGGAVEEYIAATSSNEAPLSSDLAGGELNQSSINL